MRRLLASAVLASLIGFVALDAQAQRPILGQGNLGGASLLMNKSVQEELRITEEQKDKLTERGREMFGKYREMFGKFKDLPKEEAMEQIQKMMKEAQAASEKELGEILKPEQVKRLKQIERQQNISATLTTDEEVIKELGISDDQKEKIKSIAEENAREIGGLFRQFDKDNPRETQEKIRAARKEGNEKVMQTLNDSQQSKWKDMIGEPFEVRQEGFGGFKGGGFFPGKKRPIDD